MDTNVPADLRYTSDDEWVRAVESRFVVGVTDFAQDQLGDIVFVELPAVGARVTCGEAFGVIESVKAVSDLISPLSGEVVAINAALQDTPEIVNEDCYGAGWMIEIDPSDATEVDGLHDAIAYRKSVEERS